MQIERGAPIPGHGGGAPLRYPWNMLEKGESIVVGSAGRRAAFLWAGRNGVTFTSRKIRGNDRFRVWRIA